MGIVPVGRLDLVSETRGPRSCFKQDRQSVTVAILGLWQLTMQIEFSFRLDQFPPGPDRALLFQYWQRDFIMVVVDHPSPSPLPPLPLFQTSKQQRQKSKTLSKQTKQKQINNSSSSSSNSSNNNNNNKTTHRHTEID